MFKKIGDIPNTATETILKIMVGPQLKLLVRETGGNFVD